MSRLVDADGIDGPFNRGVVIRRRGRATEPYVFAIPARQFDDAPDERTVIAGPAFAADETQQFSLTSDDLFALWAMEQAGLVGSR